MEPLIDPAGVNEFVVAALFNDSAAVEDCYLVGAANGVEAMGDDVEGAPFDENWKAVLEPAIRLRCPQ